VQVSGQVHLVSRDRTIAQLVGIFPILSKSLPNVALAQYWRRMKVADELHRRPGQSFV